MNRRRRRIPTKNDQLEAQERLREYYARSPQTKEEKVEAIDKLTIAEIGAAMWPYTYASASSDNEARDNWTDHVESFRTTNPTHYYVLSQQLLLSDSVIAVLGGARWVDEGLPVFRPSVGQVASLMATHIPTEAGAHVKPPFRAFVIDLPPGLVSLSRGDGKFVPATGVFVHVVTEVMHLGGPDDQLPPGEYWRWMCLSSEDLTLWEMNRTTTEMVEGAIIPEDAYFGIGWAMTDYDLRVRRLITRLIVGLCLDVAGKELTRTVEGDPRASGKGPHYAGPIYNVLTDPTEVREDDVLPFVHAYLAGASQSPERSRGAP